MTETELIDVHIKKQEMCIRRVHLYLSQTAQEEPGCGIGGCSS